MIETQIAQIAASIPVTNIERIPGQPETSTKFVHATTEEWRKEKSCQRTINVEPLSKALGSYLNNTIYKKICAICVPIKISEGARDIKQAWERCPRSGIMSF